jgi:hypothetical protein
MPENVPQAAARAPKLRQTRFKYSSTPTASGVREFTAFAGVRAPRGDAPGDPRALDRLARKTSSVNFVMAATSDSLFQWAIPAPSLSLRRPPMLPLASAGLGPKTLMITEKKTGVRKIPNKVTPIIPANTSVPSA